MWSDVAQLGPLYLQVELVEAAFNKHQTDFSDVCDGGLIVQECNDIKINDT